MKHANKLIGLGLALGAAVTLAAMPASARGPMGGAMGPGGFGAPGGLFAASFADLDTTGDGQITEEDLVASVQARLAEVDTDGNALISQEEFAAFAQARIAEMMQGHTMGPRAMSAETIAAEMGARMLAEHDADNDGTLSLAEIEMGDGFGRMIDRFDTDDDNAISQAEYDAAKAGMGARSAMRGHHGGRW